MSACSPLPINAVPYREYVEGISATATPESLVQRSMTDGCLYLRQCHGLGLEALCDSIHPQQIILRRFSGLLDSGFRGGGLHEY